MNKYLIEILKLRKSVTLPGFGALMVANTKTGKIVLNQHLKYDDGVLATFISEKEEIDKTEAKNMISKFVREIEADLGKGDTYDIFQFGTLSKDEKGKISFEMDASLKKESPILSSSKVTPVVKIEEKKPENTFTPSKEKENKVDEKVENKKTFIPPVSEVKRITEKVVEKTVTESKKNVEEVVDKVEEKPTLSPKELAAKKKIEEKELAKQKKEDAANKKNEEKLLAAKKKEEAKKAAALAKKNKKTGALVAGKSGEKEEKKKKRRTVPIIILLLFIGVAGFFGYKYQNQIKEMIGFTEIANHSDVDEETSTDLVDHADVADTLLTDVAIETNDGIEDEVLVEVEEPVFQNSTSGGYHAIGGGFREKSNADNYASKHGGTVLGKFDGLYLVALKSYDSRAEANADLSNLKSISEGVWVFKYSK